MKRNRPNTAAVSLKRGDAGRFTAVRAQPPQLDGLIPLLQKKLKTNPNIEKVNQKQEQHRVICRRGEGTDMLYNASLSPVEV